jgi:transposase
VILLLTEGQASDHRGAALMLLLKLPPPKGSIADRGYDSIRSRAKLTRRRIAACIPSTRLRKHPIPHDTALCRQRHRIETMFARLKDWRRIATRYDRCAHTLLTAITRAAIAIFWLRERVLSLAGPGWKNRDACNEQWRLAACRILGCGAHMMPTTLCGALQSFTMRPPPTPFRRSLRNDRANPTGC